MTGVIGLVTEKAKEKAYLTVLGFGQGNFNDYVMEEISNDGNGSFLLQFFLYLSRFR